MSDYHIFTQDIDKKSVTAVFHIPIPAVGVNAANLQWREAVKKERAFNRSTGSVLPDIILAEQTALNNGEIIEVMREIQFSSITLTDQTRKTQVDAAFTQAKSSILSEKQITLAWIGFQANVT